MATTLPLPASARALAQAPADAWRRLKRWWPWLLGLVVVALAAEGAMYVSLELSWPQYPSGYHVLSDYDFLVVAALFDWMPCLAAGLMSCRGRPRAGLVAAILAAGVLIQLLSTSSLRRMAWAVAILAAARIGLDGRGGPGPGIKAWAPGIILSAALAFYGYSFHELPAYAFTEPAGYSFSEQVFGLFPIPLDHRIHAWLQVTFELLLALPVAALASALLSPAASLPVAGLGRAELAERFD